MPKEKYPWGSFLRDYWVFLEGRRFSFLFFTSLKALSDLVPFAIAYALGRTVDFFTVYNKGDSLQEFYFLVGAITILGGAQVWLRFFAKVKMQTIAADIRKEVRIKTMSKLMDLELKWHEKEETGSKLQKINEGGESIFEGIDRFSNEGLMILTGLIGGLILFLGLDWRYLVYTLVYAAIYLGGEMYFNRKLSFWRDQLNKIKEKVGGKIHESTSNLLTVKSLGLKNVFKEKTSSYEQKYYEVWTKTRNVSQSKMKTIKIFAALGYAGFIFLLGLDVVKGAITVGSILVFSTYFGRLKDSLDQLTNKSGDFIKVKSAVGRFMTIFGVEVFGRDDLAEIPRNWKKIEFRNVVFKYKAVTVLNISLLTEERK